ncbi:glycine zipper domain-containing protein, partial [Microvirga sp. 2TAF3]|uniref:glycine zipper domain-containing protein n=1 Tax=Microvirga sp. 2TAF3 TaxID=3233014 RepID=UPI003F9AAA69
DDDDRAEAEGRVQTADLAGALAGALSGAQAGARNAKDPRSAAVGAIVGGIIGGLIGTFKDSPKVEPLNNEKAEEVKETKESSRPGTMQKEVEREKAPEDVERVDKGRGPYEQDHAHLKDGRALNKDGTWKHDNGRPEKPISNDVRDWLDGHGWKGPRE